MLIYEFTIAEVMEMEDLKSENRELFNNIAKKAVQDFVLHNDLEEDSLDYRER
jgi:hypothetical protein